MEEAIVLYPSPVIGHLISLVELGRLILTHKPSLSINILITTPPYKAGSVTPYINHVSTTTPYITFHHLPTISLPPNSISSPHHETLMFDVLHHNNPNIYQALLSISKTHTIQALIIDSFCTPALKVAAKFEIPTFCFCTSAAASLALFLYLPTIHHNTTKSLRDLDCKLDIPGLPPIPATDMPEPILERTNKAYEYFLHFSNQIPKSAGIIVNTFDILEPRAIKAISDGLCVPNGPTPPIFCIGPLIVADDRKGGSYDGGESECLKWLDSQPSQSIVFLCFGSLGLFSPQQLKEIAIGLERSGQRFLWVVRNPPLDDQNKSVSEQQSDPDLDSLLPGGFLRRTKDRGLVVKQWAPQVAVLNHGSVGGFVTHCGWNSVLEAICCGVPMVAWPLYAEQRINRVMLVEELKVALPMEESEGGFVTAAEVEKRVAALMDSEESGSIRKQTMAMKEAANNALSQGGSSSVAVTKLVDSWKQV